MDRESLRPRIDREEYRMLFEYQWRDRAEWCGWNVEFRYDENDTRLVLTPAPHRGEGASMMPPDQG
jgi:hypothetical protein